MIPEEDELDELQLANKLQLSEFYGWQQKQQLQHQQHQPESELLSESNNNNELDDYEIAKKLMREEEQLSRGHSNTIDVPLPGTATLI